MPGELDEEVQRSLIAARATVADAAQSMDAYERRLKADDRSKVAKLVMWLFVIAVVIVYACVFAAIVASFWSSVATERMNITAALNFMKDVLGSIILPVVTLVVGFYFGTEAKK